LRYKQRGTTSLKIPSKGAQQLQMQQCAAAAAAAAAAASLVTKPLLTRIVNELAGETLLF
jgi:hypothetical protein